MKNDMSHVYSVLCGTVFFVAGQYFLRKSFDKDSDYRTTWILFTLTFGLVACISIVGFQISDPMYITDLLSNRMMPKLLCAAIAGVCFVVGNMFWIYSISTKNSLGGIRTIMAGFETSLLLVLGFVAFSEKMTFQKLIGIMMVLAGIYVIG